MISDLSADGYAPATVQCHVAYLRAAMRYAHKKGELSNLPWFPTIKVENARQGFFEREEFERVASHLPQPYADIARFGYNSGWRLSEVLELHWSEVDREHGIIRLSTSKNGHGRILPMIGELTEIIDRAWRNRPFGEAISEWVFHRAGKRVWKQRFWEIWNAARNQAGLPGRLFHDLRRTAARDMIAAGCDYQTAMAVTGHRTMSMFLRYQIVDVRGIQQGLRALEAHRNGNGRHLAAA
jgi:integrase